MRINELILGGELSPIRGESVLEFMILFRKLWTIGVLVFADIKE